MRDKTRNGRRAWKHLLLHFEGSTYKERLAQEAGNILKHTNYNGLKQIISFGDYYKLHALVHTKLDSANKPMSTEQKADSLIQGIQCSTTQNIVVNIAGITALRTSFDMYYNAVASKLELAISLTNKSRENKTRNVNKINQKKRKFTPNQTEKNQKNPFVPEDRAYSAPEWAARSADKRKYVRALHRERRNKTPRSQRQPGYPQNPHATITQQSREIIPYVPPPHGTQLVSINVSQHYQPYAYGPILDDGRTINTIILPP